MNDKMTNNPEKNRVLFNRAIFTGSIIILLAVSFWLGFFAGQKKISETSSRVVPFNKAVVINQENKNSIIDFSLFWKVWDLLKEKYVAASGLDAQKLLYGSIKGLLQATGDPYTVFLDPEENKVFSEEISGSFEGIGAEMGIKGGTLTIIAPLEGSPAEKVGLRAGDKIIKIDEENSADMSLEKAVSKIRGPKGTRVKLTIFRNGSEETQEITVEREMISVKSVKAEIKDEGIGYLKISRFSEETSSEFNKAAGFILGQHSRGLILDLRNNPGGYLDAALKIGSKVVPKNKILVIEENSNGDQNKISSSGGDILSQLPTVVLINEGSASASEILAGALKENRNNVTLVGKKSFGKGLVQELVKLPEGAAAKISVARWLTPREEQINEVGISPDIDIDLTDDDYNNNRDPQLDKALEIIREKIQ